MDGRASEERPPWGYAKRMCEKMRHAKATPDIQTGSGEALAQIPQPPPDLFTTESWPPNVAIARANLAPFGATVIEVDDKEPLPLADARFDLVVSRHPTLTLWDEITRVLAPGGRYFSQQMGPGSNRELHRLHDGAPEGQRDPRPCLRIRLPRAQKPTPTPGNAPKKTTPQRGDPLDNKRSVRDAIMSATATTNAPRCSRKLHTLRSRHLGGTRVPFLRVTGTVDQ